MALSADPANAPVDDVVKPIVQVASAGRRRRRRHRQTRHRLRPLVIEVDLEALPVSDEVDTVVVADPVELGLVTRVELDRQHVTGVGPVALVEGAGHRRPLPFSQSSLKGLPLVVSVTRPPPKEPKPVPAGRVTVTVLSGYSRAPDDEVVKPIVQSA